MEIELEIKNYRCFPDCKPVKIRIGKGFVALIGVNNSGKSSLLRFFFEFRELFTQSTGQRLQNFSNAVRHTGWWNFPLSFVSDPSEIFNRDNLREIAIEIRILCDSNGSEPSGGQVKEMRLTIDRERRSVKAIDFPGCYGEGDRGNVAIGNVNQQPILGVPGRSNLSLALLLEAFRLLADTLYLGPFRNAINVDAGHDYFDIRVGQAFVAEWSRRRTGGSIQENDAIKKLEREISRIFGFDNIEINASDDNRTLKIFVNDRSFRLDELGTGLAQFIFCLANAAIRRPSFILIDEPEQNLHPSLQIDFLTTLASYAQFGVIFATHSIGLARAVGNRIYSFSRIADGRSEVTDYEATPRLAEFLGELSFSGYQELGFNKILLVEGPTDVTTFQQFLRPYRKDHQVVILQMGGKSLINGSRELELSEIRRVCDRVVAVIDSEKSTADAPVDPARIAFQEACRRARIESHILQRRATENYLSERAVKTIKGQTFCALTPYESLKDHSPGWGKNENWKIAREMTKDELSETDLGEILERL